MEIKLPEITKEDVIEAVKNQLYDEISGEVMANISRKIEDKVDHLFAETFKKIVKERAIVEIEKVIAEGFQEKETWGDDKGKLKSVKTLIAETFAQKVKRNGYRNGEIEFYKQIMEDKIEEVLKKDFIDVSAKYSNLMRESLDRQTKELLGGKLKDILGISISQRA